LPRVLDDDVQDVPSSEKRNGLGGGGHSQIMGNAIAPDRESVSSSIPRPAWLPPGASLGMAARFCDSHMGTLRARALGFPAR